MDGAGFAFSANIRFAAVPDTAVPVISVWDEFDLSVSPDYPVVFNVEDGTYAVSRTDEEFFPAGKWVKLGVSWDPEKKRLLVSRNGRTYPVKKLDVPAMSVGTETVFDVFCDRLYPHALEQEQTEGISTQGL